MIAEEIINHVNTPGQAVSFGTKDRNNQPKVGRALASKVEKDGSSCEFLVSKEIFEMHKGNLEGKGKIALNITYPPTHKSFQFKGDVLEFRNASAEDKELTKTNFSAFHGILSHGYGPEAAQHFLKHEAEDQVLVKMKVEEVFDQTPGPGAGKKVYPIKKENN
jgi:hypothetical protein